MELEARTRWALARLAELVNAGRAEAWLPGERIADLKPADSFLSSAATVKTPMRSLASRLGLSPVEVDLLWFLISAELDPKFARAAQMVMSPGMTELDAQVLERLVMRGQVFEEPVLERLVQFGLLETSFDPRVPMYRRSVRASDRVVELARGRLALDRELTDIATLASAIEIKRETAGAAIPVPTEIGRALASDVQAFVIAKGQSGSGRATVLRQAVSSTGRGVIAVRATGLAVEPGALARQLRAVARECLLHDAFPLLLDVDELNDRIDVIDCELLQRFRGPVLATACEACAWSVSRITVASEIVLPDPATLKAIWRRALPDAFEDVITACALRYRLPPGLVLRMGAAVTAVTARDKITTEHVHDALRAQLERSLLGLARRIQTRQTWDDLVLPIDQFDLLIEMVARVRHRHRVLDDWGFADKVGRGLGLSALLSGPPGTGKTMVAGLIAQELGLDLYQVDLSKVVSKYIGETEKQLAALFEAAESGHAILLFDEADSLFAKRTEVKSSNDRYANLEVNYLLQRIETFSGITLLTTNHETAIDQAFLRRLAFHIRVPMPDERQREMLWKSMLPEKAACANDLDFAGLANAFVMSGGYIKNAVLRAAFLCAEEGGVITNEHLWRAGRAEYEAMGKVSYQPAARMAL